MTQIVFYFDSLDMIAESLEDLCDKTDISEIEKIIVCNDSGRLIENMHINGLIANKTEFIDSSHIGRAKAWTIAAEKTKDGPIVFIGGVTKFGLGWLENLQSKLTDDNIVSPQVHLLDVNLWQSLSNKWERFGWRWDFELTNRQYVNDSRTTAVSSYCFAITKKRYDYLGGFDEGMDAGSGEDIEISYRNWIFGGSCVVAENSMIATAAVRRPAALSLKNINRIVQAWLPEYQNNVAGYHGQLPDAGKISGLLSLEKNRVKANQQVLEDLQPELFGVHTLRLTAQGKSIAIIATGASYDFINKAAINRNDILIGVDYMGMAIECDYVITDSVKVVTELKQKYSNDQLILPTVISNKIIGKHQLASEVCPGCLIFEQKQYGHLDMSVNPPFVDVDNIAITAINIALFMQPSCVNLYGVDNQLINGKSHSSTIGYYEDGAIFAETESTMSKLKFYEYVMRLLGDMGIKHGVPIMRISHI